MYQKSEKNFRLYLETNFKRFLDNCFLIFKQSEEDLKKFYDLLKRLHPSIRVTLDKSRQQLSFLDTLIINNNGKVQTDIYYKPIDSKQYLLYTTCHPKHTSNSIPYNLARRLKMIISEEHILLKRLEELKTFLLKQSCPAALIEDSIIKIKSLNRSNLLQTHPTNDKDNNKIPYVPYVTTFNPHNPKIYADIQNNNSLLLRDDRLKTIFKKKKRFLKVNANHQTWRGY